MPVYSAVSGSRLFRCVFFNSLFALPRGKTYGMTNIASAGFFTLSDHAARKSGTLHRFRGGENGERSQGVCAASRQKHPE